MNESCVVVELTTPTCDLNLLLRFADVYDIDSLTIEIIASSAALLHAIPKIINRYVTNP